MAIKVFFCYAHEDEILLKKLKAHLGVLQRQGIIDVWHDRDIHAGKEWKWEVDRNLNTADIILLLISPAFIASDYCYNVEATRALERHEQGEARVIPIILRPVINWQKTPFGELQTLPSDGKPILSSFWNSEDEGFFNAAEGIQKAIEEIQQEITFSTFPTRVGFSTLHEIAHLRSDPRNAVLAWLHFVDPQYNPQTMPGSRSQLDFMTVGQNKTKIGLHVFFHHTNLEPLLVIECFRLLKGVINEFQFDKFFHFFVYPNSLTAISELLTFRKSIKPPKRITLAVGYLEANNEFQLTGVIGAVPKGFIGI